jgi:anti-sigma factor RsiW
MSEDRVDAEQVEMIRAYVDGELSSDEAAALEERAAADPDVALRLRFEQGMRERVRRVMTECSTPDDLAGTVRDAIAADEEPIAIETERRSWLAGPQRANVFAVAATLAVVAGAVLFGIFGRQIDTFRPNGPGGEITEIASFVADEHQRCAGRQESRDRKATWVVADEARARLGRHLGTDVEVFDLSALGYRFVGAGACHLPGRATSGHMIYTRSEPAPDGCPESMVSVFVVPSTTPVDADLLLTLAPWEWTRAGEAPECSRRVGLSNDGTCLYYLVCCNEGDLGAVAELISQAGRSGGR